MASGVNRLAELRGEDFVSGLTASAGAVLCSSSGSDAGVTITRAHDSICCAVPLSVVRRCCVVGLSVCRLPAVQKEEVDDVETGGGTGDSTLRLLDRYAPIHKCLASISLNTKQIQQLGTKHRNTTTEKQKKGTHNTQHDQPRRSHNATHSSVPSSLGHQER